MDDNDFVIMDALFAEVKRLNADLQEEDAKEAPEGDETMEIKELIQALRADAEWAHANEWETPITLGDHLGAAADALEALLAEVKRLVQGKQELIENREKWIKAHGELSAEVERLTAENEAMQSAVRHAEELDEQLSSVTAERDAAVADIRQACTTCMHSGKPSCPWEGTYHHRGEHGEKIGVCNAWQWRGAGKEQNDG